MSARNVPRRILMLALLALAACGDATGPPTELQVENRTGDVLQVLANRCDQPLRVFAMLKDGWDHTAVVPPGCWALEAQTWPDSVHVDAVEVDVRSGILNQVAFGAP